MKAIPYPLTEAEFIDLVHHGGFKSVIGHENLANCLSRLCGRPIEFNRQNIKLSYDDEILLVSLEGRLPEKPSFVEYKGRLNFTFVRFEKQTRKDLEQSFKTIDNILKEAI